MYSHIKSLFCRLYSFPAGDFGASTRLDIQVVKSLDESYQPLDEEPGLSARVFSDDMTATYTTRTGEMIDFDSDISTCDGGNTYANFYLLGLIMGTYGFAARVRAQFARLKASIMIYNPSTPNGKREFVKVKPRTIFQGSGCPETTVVNGVASTSIILAYHTYIDYSNNFGIEVDGELAYFDTATQAQRTVILQMAASSVGHVVTIVWCRNKSETQFLKHSPFKSEKGKWVNTRNFGAIFRGLGELDGDITAKMLGVGKSEFRQLSYAQKMEMYVGGVVRGLKNEPSNIIMDALRERFTKGDTEISLSYLSANSKIDRSHAVIPISELQKRYGGIESDYYHLATSIRNMRLGSVIPSPLISSFYKTDYGL